MKARARSARNYASLLQNPRWQKQRLEVLERDGWRCSWCGDGEHELQVHHGYYGRERAASAHGEPKLKRAPWEHPSETLFTLCDSCHERAEKARAALYFEFGRIHPRYHWEVRRVLKEIQELIAREPTALEDIAAVKAE